MGIKHAFVSGKPDSGDASLVNASNWNATHTVDASGIDLSPGVTTVGQFVISQISPAGVTGAVNDWAPTGLAGATTILVTSSAAAILLNGLTGGANGRRITIVNIDATQDLTIRHENVGSIAANRIQTPFGSDILIAAGTNGTVTLEYFASRWHVVAFASFNIPALMLNGQLSMNSNSIVNVNNLTQVAGGRYDISTLAGTNQPIQQGSTIVSMFGYKLAGRNSLAVLPGDAFAVPSYLLQPLVGRKGIITWEPGPNSTVLLDNGGVAPTIQGTATARAPASTTKFSSSKRIGYVSAAGAGSVAQVRQPANSLWIGNGANLGGFFVVIRFGISDAALVATANMFVGIQPTAAATDVGPQTLTNLIGVGCTNGDTQMQLYAAGAAAQARVALGANFPVNTTAIEIYELVLYAAPNATTLINYQLTRINTGHEVDGTITVAANIPASTTFMAPTAWRSNGGTASAVGLDLFSMYCETET